MRATRVLRFQGLGGTAGAGPPKLLLPQPSGLESLGDAIQGWWAHITDQTSRDAYEEAVKKNVIKDTVLQNANSGILLTYSLFHNLSNPLFRKYKFDSQSFVEFVQTVGPALENFHDTLGRLRNEFSETQDEDQKEKETSQQQEHPTLGELAAAKPTIQSLLGSNQWLQQAEQDKDSLAGNLSGMTTATMMDALFYTSKLDILSRATLNDSPSMYVPGSVKVNDVALLHCRAMMLDRTGNETVSEFSEFQATDDAEGTRDENADVAAQVDVLFEFEATYTRKGPSSPSEIIASMASPPAPTIDQGSTTAQEEVTSESGNNEEDTSNTQKDGVKESSDNVDGGGDSMVETLTYTNLAVAVFEGWLHRGANGGRDSLQWRISMLRDAFEFPHHEPTITSSRTP